MTVAVNITDGWGLNNGEFCELVTTKEEQGNAVLTVHFTVNAI